MVCDKLFKNYTRHLININKLINFPTVKLSIFTKFDVDIIFIALYIYGVWKSYKISILCNPFIKCPIFSDFIIIASQSYRENHRIIQSVFPYKFPISNDFN